MIPLFHKSYGHSGEPLVILHGLFGMLDNWHLIAQKLSTDYRVITVDLRNHGHSPHADDMSYELMAEDVSEFILQSGFPQAHIIGHSMGGKVAMTLTKLFPEKVSKLIVVDIAPRQYPGGHDVYFRALKLLQSQSLNSRSQADELIAPLVPDFGVRQFLLKNLYRNPEGKYLMRMNVAAIENNYDKISGRISFGMIISTPSLFVKGSQSNYINSTDEVEIEKTFSNCHFVSIPEAGHWVHADQPEGFLAATRLFLTK